MQAVLNLLLVIMVSCRMYIRIPPAPTLVLSVSEKTDTWPPVVLARGFWIDDDLVGERICVGGSDGRNVVFIAVYNGDDFVGGFFKGFGHGTSDFEHI